MQTIATTCNDQQRLQTDADYTRLAQAVIIAAAHEARKGDAAALAWLMDPATADTWGIMAKIRWSAVMAWCVRLQAKRG